MKIGIIGGSGLDDPNLIQDYQEIEVETPFGKPSSKLITGKISGIDLKGEGKRTNPNHWQSERNIKRRLDRVRKINRTRWRGCSGIECLFCFNRSGCDRC